MAKRVKAKAGRQLNENLVNSALAGGAAASVLNIIILWAAKGAGYSPMVKSGGMLFPEPLTIVQVAVACFVPAIGAAIIWGLLRRYTRTPSMLFYKVAVIFLVFSLTGPVLVPVNRLATRFILGAMHLVAAGAIIGSLQRMGGLKR